MKIMLTVLLLLPALASATDGAWSQRVPGVTLSVGRQEYAGRWLTAPSSMPLTAAITHISWRITPLSNAGEKLQIKLCQEARCVPLNTLSGQMKGRSFFSPRGRFRMVYSVARPGRIAPPLTVVNLELTVNYRF